MPEIKANANIAFMGDSITNYWDLPTTNLGVPGNTSAEMLARFPDEVLNKGYKAVVILAGTNDIRNLEVPIATEVAPTIEHITQMAALAAKNKLIVVLCEVPPIENEDDRAEALNVEIVKLAQEQGYLYVDYYSPMVNHPEYFKDSVHPNTLGYSVMRVALQQAISISE